MNRIINKSITTGKQVCKNCHFQQRITLHIGGCVQPDLRQPRNPKPLLDKCPRCGGELEIKPLSSFENVMSRFFG